ncbi:hypothetical protein HYD75_03900 [Mycoplasmopsis bovis]|nr:hypothetical protein [Mycoplasmopsis bovis]QQH48792.1 hypothetical protein HYD75_03900 [Mycoplasmopsis bovis]
MKFTLEKYEDFEKQNQVSKTRKLQAETLKSESQKGSNRIRQKRYKYQTESSIKS